MASIDKTLREYYFSTRPFSAQPGRQIMLLALIEDGTRKPLEIETMEARNEDEAVARIQYRRGKHVKIFLIDIKQLVPHVTRWHREGICQSDSSFSFMEFSRHL